MPDSTMINRDERQSMRQRVEDWRQLATGFRQLWLIAGMVAAVAVGVWVFTWSQQPALAPLFTGLDVKDSGAVVEALRSTGIDFQIDQATGSIMVPDDKLHELRMKLATQGLPLGEPQRPGLESIQGDQGFGVSQFIESARYQSAIETELARTIATLQPVRAARVHLAIPKPTAFAAKHDGASASVVLELHSGRSLDSNQVAAVVHLVSSSVAGLDPDRVTVVDQTGQLLTNPDPNSAEAETARQFAETRRLEDAFANRIRRVLEPITGAGRVAAQVNVDMDYSTVEEAREAYANDPNKIRSEQTSEQQNGPAAAAVGVPGATSNTPPGSTGANLAGSGGSNSRSSTRNYELDRTLTHTRLASGRVNRMTAAVVIDYLPQTGAKGAVTMRPLTADELARMEQLVRQAIGFDQDRGDVVSVVNAKFATTEKIKETDPPIWEQLKDTPPLVTNSLRLLLGAAVVLILIFTVIRPALKQLTPPPLPKSSGLSVDNPMMGAPGIDGQIQREHPPGLPASDEAYEDAFRKARGVVGEDPKRVAQLMKNWLNENG